MKLDTGTIVTIVAVVLFYIRLVILQSQKSRSLSASDSTPPSGRRSKGKKKSEKKSEFFKFHISSWPLVIAGVVTISAGALLNAISPFGATVNALWWIPVSIGIVLLAFSYN